MMAPSYTNELKIPEKVLTLCSKCGPIEKRLVRSMIRQVIWEIPLKVSLVKIRSPKSMNCF